MPFDDSLNVDLDSLRNEVASFGADGCGGLVALGVFGEAASLDPDEANTVASTVALSTDLPYAPTGRTDGANRRRGRGGRHKRLSTPARCDGIGILIQDYPVISGVNVTDEQVVEIVLACPFAVGVKSETPPTSVAVAHLASELDVPVFGGLGGVGKSCCVAGASSRRAGCDVPRCHCRNACSAAGTASLNCALRVHELWRLVTPDQSL